MREVLHAHGVRTWPVAWVRALPAEAFQIDAWDVDSDTVQRLQAAGVLWVTEVRRTRASVALQQPSPFDLSTTTTR